MKTYENLITLSASAYRDAAAQVELGNIWEADHLAKAAASYSKASIALEGGKEAKANTLASIALLWREIALGDSLELNDRVALEDYLGSGHSDVPNSDEEIIELGKALGLLA